MDATTNNGRMGRMVNHSKKCPNVIPKIEEDGIPRICLFAARDIDENEELLYDYGERNAKVVQCHPWLTN